jgi:hypothetical protein
MNSARSGVCLTRRKLLGFTDNRQDAALQAGHFNVFCLFRCCGRRSIPRLRRLDRMAFRRTNSAAKCKLRLALRQPTSCGALSGCSILRSKAARLDAERTLARVLTYRVWSDQRRGWRFTNPNLEELGLLRAEYMSLDDLAMDNEAFTEAPPELRNADPATRRNALSELLDMMRRGLAITADALEPTTVEATAGAARQTLREPWSISQQEHQRHAAALIIDAPKKADMRVRDEPLVLRAGPRSSLARRLGHQPYGGGGLTGRHIRPFCGHY